MIPRTSKFWQTSSKNSTLYPFSEKSQCVHGTNPDVNKCIANTHKAYTSKTNLIT